MSAASRRSGRTQPGTRPASGRIEWDVAESDFPQIKLRAYGIRPRTGRRSARSAGTRISRGTDSDWEDDERAVATEDDLLGPLEAPPLPEVMQRLRRFALEDRIAERRFREQQRRAQQRRMQRSAGSSGQRREIPLELPAQPRVIEHLERRAALYNAWLQKYLAEMHHGKRYWQFVSNLGNVEPRINVGRSRRAQRTAASMRRGADDSSETSSARGRAQGAHAPQKLDQHTQDICRYLELKRLQAQARSHDAVVARSIHSWERRRRLERRHERAVARQEHERAAQLSALRERIHALHAPSRLQEGPRNPRNVTVPSHKSARRRVPRGIPATLVAQIKPLTAPRPESGAVKRAATAATETAQTLSVPSYKVLTDQLVAAHSGDVPGIVSEPQGDLALDLDMVVPTYHTPVRLYKLRDHVYSLKLRSAQIAADVFVSPAPDEPAAVDPPVASVSSSAPLLRGASAELVTAPSVTLIREVPDRQPATAPPAAAPSVPTRPIERPAPIPLTMGDLVAADTVKVLVPNFRAPTTRWVVPTRPLS